jgi:hypothetical protein
MQETAHARVCVVALEKAKDNAGVDQRADQKPLRAKIEAVSKLKHVTERSSHCRPADKEEGVGDDPQERYRK